MSNFSKLVIVESPAKAKTINKFLGKDFKVESSGGHIIDLPKTKFGIDIENNFKPTYTVIKGKSKILKHLQELAKKVKEIYLASDPDREGEAIAWHLENELKKFCDKIYRVEFNEITKSAVTEAFKKKHKVNINMVESQQARRLLDRIVGYMVSPLLWKVIHYGLSAGRVQSVALRLICEREEEINSFIPEEYWTIEANLLTNNKQIFKANLVKVDGNKAEIKNSEMANILKERLEKSTYKIINIEKKERKRAPLPPYKTSTLQQDASRILGFSSQKTMMIAQKLYEGIEIGEYGSVGLITYMRTDSIRISNTGIEIARKFIKNAIGDEYLPKEPIIYKANNKAQDAHEAIRPTYYEYPPDSIKKYLSTDEYKLYKLIWNRFIASQMNNAIYSSTSIEINADNCLFKTTGSTLIFDGFLKIYNPVEIENNLPILPDLNIGEILTLDKLTIEQHFTKPKPRYNEASLIKELEKLGIGRPSTYATIVSTILNRKYVVKNQSKSLIPTELGISVNKFLTTTFPDIINVNFTAYMENDLDSIENNTKNWIEVMNDFYIPFSKILKETENNIEKLKESTYEKLDEECPECKEGKLIIKWGKNGRFISCTRYPDCKYTQPLEKDEITDYICEKCGANMVIKQSKKGRFLACSGYPKCKNTKPFPTGVKCQKCKEGDIVEKNSKTGRQFFGCNRYPECDFTMWTKPVPIKCPNCEAEFIVEKYSQAKGTYFYCISCKKEVEIAED